MVRTIKDRVISIMELHQQIQMLKVRLEECNSFGKKSALRSELTMKEHKLKHMVATIHSSVNGSICQCSYTLHHRDGTVSRVSRVLLTDQTNAADYLKVLEALEGRISEVLVTEYSTKDNLQIMSKPW